MDSTHKDNGRGRTVQLLALAWGLYAISFFLPAISAGGPKAEGWRVFLECFEVLFHSDIWIAWQTTATFYDVCNLCTLISPAIFWMGPRRWNHSLSLVLGTALALGTLSFVYANSADRSFDHLYAGYYIWLGSMATLAAVLFHYGRTSKAAVTS